jgi:predicted transcriptional regulator
VSKVVSLRLRDDQVERLSRNARRMGRTPSTAAAKLLGQHIREREFPRIEFREGPGWSRAVCARDTVEALDGG